jgi:tetratricopeptide (TPR) repeat protein
MKQKLDAGDTDTAMKLAEKAMALRPRNEEVQTTLLQLQARHEDWAGARATLSKALKAGNVPRDLHKRRDAVLALAHARDAMAEGKIAEATRDATEANRLAPSLVPAAAMAARLAIAENKPKVATKILKAAWATDPHPDLAAAFAEIAPGETPNDRLKRFQPLIAKHAGNPEAKLLEAELQIAREDFPAARRALGDLAETRPRRGRSRSWRPSSAAKAPRTASFGLACTRRDRIARAAMDLRQLRPCPCRMAPRLRQLRKLRHPQLGRSAAIGGRARRTGADAAAHRRVAGRQERQGRSRTPTPWKTAAEASETSRGWRTKPRRGRALGRRKPPFPSCRAASSAKRSAGAASNAEIAG